MFYNGPYLRVLTPRTKNGTELLIDETTGATQYREAHLPITARRKLESLNKNLPQYLRKQIEVINPVAQQPVSSAVAQAPVDDVLDSIMQNVEQKGQVSKQTTPVTPNIKK